MAPETNAFLDGWRNWDTPPRSRPAVVRELGGGRSNHSYLLASAGHRMVLRVNTTASTLAGIGRGHEADIWRAASAAGIAPPLIHADPGGRFLVSAYIESDLPDRPQDDPGLAARALDLLHRTHQLDVGVPTIGYAAHIETYWHRIESGNLAVDPRLLGQREPMQRVLAGLLDSQPEPVLCHHDPVVANFVGTSGRLYLLDWEYAARGLAVMDYAALAAEWGIDDQTLAVRAGIGAGSLAKARTLYRYLCTLWETAGSSG